MTVEEVRGSLDLTDNGAIKNSILQSGMTTKDFIAPTSFLFKSGKDFMMSDTYGAASYLNILAPELTDKVLAEFLDMDKNLVVSIHVQSVDQLKAIKGCLCSRQARPESRNCRQQAGSSGNQHHYRKSESSGAGDRRAE